MRSGTRWVRQMRFVMAGVLLAGLFSALPLATTPVAAASPDVVISQVYPGGGSSTAGTAYTRDYVELFNRSNAPVTLTNFSLQYAAATGSFAATDVLNASITIPAGGFYLIQEGSAGTAGAAVPNPDETGGLNLSGTSGAIALVSGTNTLMCNVSFCAPSDLARIKDRVGYGTSTNPEGTAAPSPTSTAYALVRTNACQDNDNNGAEFANVMNPVPRNSMTPVMPCGPTRPAITGIMPTSGPATGGTTVTISGTNFSTMGTTVVTFGGVMATNVTVTSPTTITATTPAAAEMAMNSTVPVAVTNNGQAATGTASFTYIVAGAPTLAGISPTAGPTTGGTNVTITGTNFSMMGTTTVMFGSTMATNVTVVNDTTITATTPAATMAGMVPVTVTTNGQTATGSATFTYQPVAGTTRIRDIQGASHTSPLIAMPNATGETQNGPVVTNVPGIVTALARSGGSNGSTPSGFFLQDPSPDANPATSEGIFIFTSTAPAVAVGDSVLVSGTVQEFRPINSTFTDSNLRITEIDARAASGGAITVLSPGNPVPAPIRIGTGGRVPPAQNIDDDTMGIVGGPGAGVFDPDNDALDFYESLEGMRVEILDPQVVGPFGSFPSGREVIVIPGDLYDAQPNKTARGGVRYDAYERPNARRIFLTDANNSAGMVGLNAVDVGYRYGGTITGVIDYGFNNYKFIVTAPVPGGTGGGTKEVTNTPTANQLAVATFNVENLAATDPQAKFDALASIIVNNMKSPDIIALEEVQDNNGTGTGILNADATLNTLIARIAAQTGGPTYTFRQINPAAENTDGGQPNGNIRLVFLYRTDRGLAFVDRPGGTPTAATGVTNAGGQPQLTFSPGRVDPTNPAFNNSRKPLVGEFTWQGQTFFAIANHFNSKGGDDALFGNVQPPGRSSEVQRQQQATIVRDFVNQLLAVNANAKVVVLGDLNDFEFSPVLATVKGTTPPLTNLVDTLPPEERYTYDFNGNSQTLDHTLLSRGLTTNGNTYAYDIVHVNSEFRAPFPVTYNAATDQISDHDPQVTRLTFASPTMPSQVQYTFTGPMNGNTGAQTFSVTARLTPGSDITDQTLLRYRATLTRDGMPVSGLSVMYITAGDSGSFTLDGNGTAFFGPSTGFRYGDVPGLTTTGASTTFATNVAQPGTYVLTVQLVNVTAMPNADVGMVGTQMFTLVSPDLALTKSANGTFAVGQNASYTLTVTNTGTGATTGAVTVTDTLPNGLTFVPAGSGGAGWSCMASGQTVTCTNPGPIAANGGTSMLTLVVAVGGAAFPAVTNSASVTTERDVNAANNATTPVMTAVVAPDLTLTKSDMNMTFVVGQNGTYTLTVTNGGSGATTGVVTVTDMLPNGLTFASGSGAGWMCTASGQTVTCTTNGPIGANGGTSTLTLVVSVGPTAISGMMNTATVTNTATVAAANESNTGNNTGSDMTVVEFAAPTIADLSPREGPTTGGTTVTIAGTGFRTGATVTFNGVAATNVTVVNATTITAVSPAGAAGPKSVLVTNPGNRVSNAHAFVYTQTNVPVMNPPRPSEGPRSARPTAPPATGMPNPAPPRR